MEIPRIISVKTSVFIGRQDPLLRLDFNRVQGDRRQQDDSLEHFLVVLVDPHQDKRIVQDAYDHHAGHCVADLTPAAHDRDAAQYNGRHRVKGIVLRRRRLRRVRAGGHQHAGDGCKETADCEHRNTEIRNIHAR